jgi:pimeloyl-ACP methyl ester carboxylesterase
MGQPFLADSTAVVAPGTPVVFVHGLWLHADSWGAWVDLFRESGYVPTAPGWPGDSGTVAETRSRPEHIAGHGIDDVVDHYAKIIGGLDAKPIVVGHSFGGLIVQRLLVQGGRGGGGDRSSADQGRRLPAAVGTARRFDRTAQPC